VLLVSGWHVGYVISAELGCFRMLTHTLTTSTSAWPDINHHCRCNASYELAMITRPAFLQLSSPLTCFLLDLGNLPPHILEPAQ
jgi:hypothetical protein